MLLQCLVARAWITQGKEASLGAGGELSQQKKELCKDSCHEEIVKWGGTGTLQSPRLKKLVIAMALFRGIKSLYSEWQAENDIVWVCSSKI